jgi:hypothetical protein
MNTEVLRGLTTRTTAGAAREIEPNGKGRWRARLVAGVLALTAAGLVAIAFVAANGNSVSPSNELSKSAMPGPAIEGTAPAVIPSMAATASVTAAALEEDASDRDHDATSSETAPTKSLPNGVPATTGKRTDAGIAAKPVPSTAPEPTAPAFKKSW